MFVGEQEVQRFVDYFLAGITLPQSELWVNLSPYEADRITPDALAITDLGQDMLGQDYVLKQLAASLTNPNTETGRAYWSEIATVGRRGLPRNDKASSVIASEAKQSQKQDCFGYFVASQ